MTPPRKPRKPPPHVVAGGGGAGFGDGEPVHIVELWVRDIESARDMVHGVRRKRALADRLRDDLAALIGDPYAGLSPAQRLTRAANPPPMSREAKALHLIILQLDRQTLQDEELAVRIRADRVAKLIKGVDYGERDQRGEQARTAARERAGVVTRVDFGKAVEATLSQRQTVTLGRIKANWPIDAIRPSDRHLSNMIRDWKSEQSK